MTPWTDEALAILSDDELLNLLDNCDRSGTGEARSLQSRIEGQILARDRLSVGDTGLKLDSPVGKLLVRLVNSPDAVRGAVEATQQGRPALAGIEPLLVERMGLSYSQRYEATVQAGYVVARMMERLGHKRSGKKGPMPDGSVATSAEIYLLKT